MPEYRRGEPRSEKEKTDPADPAESLKRAKEVYERERLALKSSLDKAGMFFSSGMILGAALKFNELSSIFGLDMHIDALDRPESQIVGSLASILINSAALYQWGSAYFKKRNLERFSLLSHDARDDE